MSSLNLPSKPQPAVKKARAIPPWVESRKPSPTQYKSRWVEFHHTNGPRTSTNHDPYGLGLPPIPQSDADEILKPENQYKPWRGLPAHVKAAEDRKAERTLLQRTEHYLLNNAAVLLILRLTCWIFSAIGLALAASILAFYSDAPGIQPTTSTLIAIVVNSVSLFYILFITYDEYTGKPIGLRPARSKLRLLFLDIFFIIFMSANLSLQFESVTNNESYDGNGAASSVPEAGQEVGAVLAKATTQITLACVILIALIAWLFTFSISVLRVVDRDNKRSGYD